jgi:putative tricarboxylic transport membrane protein
MLESLGPALAMLMKPSVWGVMVLASAYGLFVGAMPGLTATMATALLVPFTFFMDPFTGLAAIVTMEAMAIFAGDIPAALVRIPGTPSSAAYTDDSYELAKQGKAELVLGVDLVCSAIGGIMGALALMIAATALAEVAVRFTSFEYFWLGALGLSATAMVSQGAFAKGALSIVFGLFLSTVGLDITLGFPRFTLGTVELMNGVNFIPAMIGLFGISEVIRNVTAPALAFEVTRVNHRQIFHGVWSVLSRYRWNVLRSGGIGTFIGVLPGAGADVAAWLAYGVSKRFSKTPERFGKGHMEPVVDAGTANNACLAGDWVPALVFGIPGDAITAIVIGVLFMKGVRPGPLIFEQQRPLLYALYLTFILANVLMIPFGYLAVWASAKTLRVPRALLLPGILMFCIVGAYAINNSYFDVGVMLVMGVAGYLFEANGFPVAPVVLGLVLGPIVEQNFMVSMIKTNWDVTQFVSRPVSALLAALTLATWVLPLLPALLRRRRA